MRLGPRPAQLVGRDHLLAALASGLGVPQGPPKVRVLRGLGGVGKTSVAVEFAHRQARAYGLVWQFNTEDPAALDGQIGQLAALLGALEGPGDVLDRVHAHLAGMNVPWLLVLDNVTDPTVVSRLVPAAGAGHVLVTTQRRGWSESWIVDVPVLDRDVAVDFLLSHAMDGDAQAAGALADALGFLPLALAQAAAFLRNTGRSIAEYLELLSSERVRMLGRVVPGGYGRAVAGAWNAAVEQVQATGPGPLALLRLMACYAPDAVPVRLLLPYGAGLPDGVDIGVAGQLKSLIEDRLALDDALIALGEYSLISQVQGGAVSVHRLVQATTLDAMSEQERAAWRDAAARLLDRALPEDPELPQHWPTFAALLAHAEAVLPAWHNGLLLMCLYLGDVGDYGAARDSARRVSDARTRYYGPEHQETLDVRVQLARCTGEAGDIAAARDQLAALLLVQKRILGPEHPNTLVVEGDLADWTGMAGDASAARDQLTALLPVEERILGPEHPNTLITRSNLAYWTGTAGDAAAARDQYAELLPVLERVLGPEHPRALTTRANLARWTGMAGDATAARDQYAALLPVEERVLGPEHPHTLINQGNLAGWTGVTGNAGAARDQYAALLRAHERVLGAEHPSTLATRQGLAYWTAAAEDAARLGGQP